MKIRRGLASFILFFAFQTIAFALNPNIIREETLSNGLHVITYEMDSAPMIYSRLTYNVGAKNEPYGQTGISHIVEHMMFKGTDRFSKGKISKLISDNGGIFNAFTSSDITVYYEFLPKNKIDLAFDIEAERMYKCKFDPVEFESEIDVIKEERKMRTENTPQGMKREEMNTIIYKSHPYKNPVIGWMHDIDRITRKQAYAYYKKYYTPNNATLVLCGDFDHNAIMEKVKKYFGDIPRGPEPNHPEFVRVESQGKKTLEFRHSELQEESINMHFNVPTRAHADGPALYVVSKIFAGRSSTSRLNKRLVRDEELCTIAAGGYGMSKDPRTFAITAQLRPEATIEEVETIIWEEIDSMKYTPTDDYDFQKIKNEIEFEEKTGDQYISKLGGSIGLYENYFGWEFINQWPDRVQQVTKEDLMRVMKTYFIDKNLFVCYAYPDSASAKDVDLMAATEAPDSSLTDEDDIDISVNKKSFIQKIAGMFSHNVPMEELYKPDLDDVIAPKPIEPLVEKFTLDNDVPVYLVENHDFPTIYVMGYIENGRLQENEDYPGFTTFITSMLGRGTTSKTYDEILETRSFTPYHTRFNQGWSGITFSGYSLKEDTDTMLTDVYDILVNSTFPEDQIEKIRPRLINSAEKYNNKKEMQAFYKMFTGIFEGHQYALPHAGDPEAFKKVTRQHILDHYNKYFSPERLKLVVVGDCNEEWIKEKLNKELGQWQKPSGDPMLPFSEIKPLERREVYAVNMPDAKQCRVDIGFNPVKGGIKNGNPDLPALKILEQILCGSTLTSRMGVELRDNRGLCYSIRSNLWVREHGGYWNIRTNTDANNVSEMVSGMLEQIKKVQQEGVTREELEKAKYRSVSLLSFQLRTPDDIGAKVFEMLKNEQPLDHFDHAKERYMAVTAEDVKRVANKYLDPDHYILSVSGNITKEELKEFE
ncbi:MAG: M16 family metallopeptidase [Fidelibacterota bacterium]